MPDLLNPKHLEFVSSFDYHMNVEGIEEHLREFKKAVDCCVLLNHWNIAVELA